MYRKIRSKLVILGNRKPYKKEVQDLLRHVEKKNWIYFNMRLEGSQISLDNLETILTEDKLVDLPLEDLILLRNLEGLYENLGLWAEERRPLSRKVMGAIYQALTGEEPKLRKHQPTVIEWSYSPIFASEIEEAIDGLIEMSKEETFDVLDQAINLHNQFLKIFPFNQANQLVARCVMTYYTLYQGLPVPCGDIREEEYNEILWVELNKGWKNKDASRSGLYEYVGQGVLDMLNLADNLTAEYR